ncbi:colorectal mutant cancer protein-like [Macrosteles quadrilineatus]|uniref:colorectal mutant cancer protein-like n=1 Tax=Macrosteles quadrilineatus TaxID=74068 RepID=UPI0023E2B32F|nr:colorectal mutant cancer protein-like [Macrosteles quadrilineatus]
MAELEQNSACSEETSSLCDEERVRKLFQACDADGDGFIDSQDLLNVCRELNLEDSLEELMKELGADESGRISYKEFLRRRLALRPEIEALRTTPHHSRGTPDYLPTSSDNSLGGASGGKCGESWEFDSGARDLSPEPNTLQRLVEAAGCSLTATNTASLLQLANKLHLAALASLRGEILDLTSRLHAVTHERDMLERTVAQTESSVAQQYEERLTELHCVIAELSRKMERQRTLVITEEEDVVSETEQSVETCSQADETLAVEETILRPEDDDETREESQMKSDSQSHVEEELQELRARNSALEEQLSKTEAELRQAQAVLSSVREDRDKLRLKVKEVFRPSSSSAEAPVLKIAERVRLRKMDRHVTGSDLTSLGVSHTEVAEQLVSELQSCDLQEWDRHQLEQETKRLSARLEHSRSQANVLQLTLDEAKSHCERLYLLLGKYESNVIACRLALNSSDRAIEAYDLLVSLLDSHLNDENVRVSEEEQLRELISCLKAERGRVRDTVVELESLVDLPPPPYTTPASAGHSRKLDLETAVLMQELMAMREDKAELRAKIYLLEREKENQELKVATLQSQQQAHLATIQHLQAQLHEADTEEVNSEGRESRLRERLKEVAGTLERVSRNAELRQRQATELTNELKTANNTLVQTLERCKRKSQARLRRLDTQMLNMVEQHAAQVRTLKQRIASLEETLDHQSRQSHSSKASETSL